MASAELPSFYGQNVNGQKVKYPSKKMDAQSNATDMANNPSNATPSTQFGHAFQEKPANDSNNDAAINGNLRQRQQAMNGLKPSKLENGNRRDRRSSSRHSYRNPDVIGHDHDHDDGSDSSSEGSMDSEEYRRHRRRRHLRRKLKRKHEADVIPLRLPWTKWMHSDTKNHFVAFVGEFVGTTMFLFFAFAGTQVANIGSGNSTNQSTTGAATGFNPTVYLYIALCFGFSLVVNAWIFFRISGGLFNPAVTFALALLGALHVGRAVFLFIAQVTGACFSAYLVKVIFPTTLNVRTTLAVGTSVAQGLFIEAICTAELVFTIIMLAKEKHKATYIAPVGIGLSLFIGELVAVYYTGGSLNPARSFGPSAVTHSFSSNDWIYWVGPLIGSILAVIFYWFIKVLEYEMVNPGQDGDRKNDPTQNPEHEMAQVVLERAAEVEELRAVEEEGGVDVLADLTDGESVVSADFAMAMVQGAVEGAAAGAAAAAVQGGEGDGEGRPTSPKSLLSKRRSRKSSVNRRTS